MNLYKKKHVVCFFLVCFYVSPLFSFVALACWTAPRTLVAMILSRTHPMMMM